MHINMNADVGEGFGRYSIGDDAAMLGIVDAANIACGMHAGDPVIMARTLRLAATRGVSIGAHPGFNDLWGFGRRAMPTTTSELQAFVLYQIGALQSLARAQGVQVS